MVLAAKQPILTARCRELNEESGVDRVTRLAGPAFVVNLHGNPPFEGTAYSVLKLAVSVLRCTNYELKPLMQQGGWTAQDRQQRRGAGVTGRRKGAEGIPATSVALAPTCRIVDIMRTMRR